MPFAGRQDGIVHVHNDDIGPLIGLTESCQHVIGHQGLTRTMLCRSRYGSRGLLDAWMSWAALQVLIHQAVVSHAGAAWR